jgi:hypothetical protein
MVARDKEELDGDRVTEGEGESRDNCGVGICEESDMASGLEEVFAVEVAAGCLTSSSLAEEGCGVGVRDVLHFDAFDAEEVESEVFDLAVLEVVVVMAFEDVADVAVLVTAGCAGLLRCADDDVAAVFLFDDVTARDD